MKKIVMVLCLLLCFSGVCFADSIPKIYGDAEVRTEEPLGIRVKAQIATATADNENTIEYGFIVSRKVFLDSKNLPAESLTHECPVQYTVGVSKGLVDGEYVDRFFEKNDETVFFAAYFRGISERFYTDTIVYRPYIMTESGIFYGDASQTSLYDTAKRICSDEAVFNDLDEQQKKVIGSVILAVDGEPYFIDRHDLRIVISSKIVKNENPSYSVMYRLFDPFTGEILDNVKGRKKSKNYDEIEAMVLLSGKIVPVHNGVVQDTTEGYIAADLNDYEPKWIGGFNDGVLSVSEYDSRLTCKDCIDDFVSENSVPVSAGIDTPVSVFDGNIENAVFSLSDMTCISKKDLSLLCHNGDVYSNYIKAYVSIDEYGCEYVIVIANGSDNVLEEKCLKHTPYNVEFYSDGNLYEKQTVLYGTTATLPVNPEKDGYTFLGWSLEIGGEVVEVNSVTITQNTSFYAVFERIPVYYRVEFISDGKLYSAQTVLENGYAEVPESPSIDGYEFLGWSESEDGAIICPDSISVNSDMVFYAVFEKLIVNCEVTFMFEGTILEHYTVMTDEISPVPDTMPDTAEGYKFMGWSLSADNDRKSIVDVSSFVIREDTVFYSVIITNPNDSEFMEKLNKGYTELAKIKRVSGNTKKAIELIRNTISNVLAEANDFNYIDKDYILRVYGTEVNEAKRIISDVMTETERSQFANLVKSNVSDDVEVFLKDYFKISMEI